jgi:cytochrome P450 family 6
MLLAIILSVLLVCLTVLVKRQYSHWKNLGIPYFKPTFPFGNILPVAKNKRAFGTAMYDLYKQSSEPFMGLFLLFRPALLVIDKDIVKNILTKDFEHFHDRGAFCNKSDPMSANLFTMPGETWKPLRNKITPAFTSGKLKGMFPLVQDVANNLVNCLKPLAEKNSTIDIFDFTLRFVVDCLASVAFGQEGISTINDPEHEFRTTPDIINDGSIMSIIRSAGFFAFPG